jgi:hypothetical protein
MSTNPPPSTPLLPVIWTLTGLLALCILAVLGLTLLHVGNMELVTSLGGLAGLCVAGLVGLLASQQARTHAVINGRMDELVRTTREAAFAHGQSTTGPNPHAPELRGPGPGGASQSPPPSSSG